MIETPMNLQIKPEREWFKLGKLGHAIGIHVHFPSCFSFGVAWLLDLLESDSKFGSK